MYSVLVYAAGVRCKATPCVVVNNPLFYYTFYMCIPLTFSPHKIIMIMSYAVGRSLSLLPTLEPYIARAIQESYAGLWILPF